MTPTAILALPMKENDADAPTIRVYLHALLARVWEEEEGFSGKRPFGNSGWKSDVWQALIAGDALPGTLDSDGYVSEIDSDAADKIIMDAIKVLCDGPSKEG